MFLGKRESAEAETLRVYQRSYEALKQENAELKEEVVDLKLTVSDLKLGLAEAQSLLSDLYREIREMCQ